MFLAWYFIDVWNKPTLYLTPLDELAIAAEVIVVLGAAFVVAFVWLAARDAKIKRRSDSPQVAAWWFTTTTTPGDQPPATGVNPVPTPTRPPRRPMSAAREHFQHRT